MMMTLLGAEGETKRELAKVLFNANGCTDEQVDALVKQYCNACKSMMESSNKVMKIANLVYTDKRHPLQSAFEETVKSRFDARCRTLDIKSDPDKSVQVINDDVSEATNKLIPSLIDKLSPVTGCILVNAIYFDAKWTKPFNTNDTDLKAKFTKSNGQVANCALMSMKVSLEFDGHIILFVHYDK